MENHDHHHQVGLPEWGVTEEEARETVEAMQSAGWRMPEPEEAPEKDPAVQQRAAWNAVRKAHWAWAWLALERNDWEALRRHKKMAERARNAADPMIAAVMGGPLEDPPADAVASGQTVTPHQAAEAEKAVMSAIRTRHRAKKKATPARKAKSPRNDRQRRIRALLESNGPMAEDDLLQQIGRDFDLDRDGAKRAILSALRDEVIARNRKGEYLL
ncbi:hypothetical protein [Thioalkalivibrio sp. ALE19]|uniref:hypothetical protein n=1 Tax=Thioalkalivibrio sp. ALE19 TaxID=1266909 RepID=UPI000401F950|nr:hypothetical protein [Thioalkalivibrio sp. ALE19]